MIHWIPFLEAAAVVCFVMAIGGCVSLLRRRVEELVSIETIIQEVQTGHQQIAPHVPEHLLHMAQRNFKETIEHYRNARWIGNLNTPHRELRFQREQIKRWKSEYESKTHDMQVLA